MPVTFRRSLLSEIFDLTSFDDTRHQAIFNLHLPTLGYWARLVHDIEDMTSEKLDVTRDITYIITSHLLTCRRCVMVSAI